MPAPSVIGGMWGTSRLALFLLDPGNGEILRSRSGPGVSKIGDRDFEDILFGLCADWVEQSTDAVFVLSGMVGSTIGWFDVPYLDCPVDVREVARHCASFEVRGHPVYVAPGLACTNLFGQADVMRGEETELLGLMDRDDNASARRRYVCVPGTHSKWIEIENGRILKFFTSITGELYDVLDANGVLTSGAQRSAGYSDAAFLKGIRQIAEGPEFLLNHLFSVRANVVRGGTSTEGARDVMSGLLIGADVAAAARTMNLRDHAVSVIGTERLSRRYVRALEFWDVSAKAVGSSDLTGRGLKLLADNIDGAPGK